MITAFAAVLALSAATASPAPGSRFMGVTLGESVSRPLAERGDPQKVVHLGHDTFYSS